MKQLYGKELCSGFTKESTYTMDYEYNSMKECQEQALKQAFILGHKMGKFKKEYGVGYHSSHCECGSYIFIERNGKKFKVKQKTAYGWRNVRWCSKINDWHFHKDRCFMVELNGRRKATETRKFNLLQRDYGHILSDQEIKKILEVK